jgi:hypothetical protein
MLVHIMQVLLCFEARKFYILSYPLIHISVFAMCSDLLAVSSLKADVTLFSVHLCCDFAHWL